MVGSVLFDTVYGGGVSRGFVRDSYYIGVLMGLEPRPLYMKCKCSTISPENQGSVMRLYHTTSISFHIVNIDGH